MLRGNFPNNSPVHIASTDNKITHYEHYFGVGYSAEYNTIRFWFDIKDPYDHYGFIIKCHQRAHANNYIGYQSFIIQGKNGYYDLKCIENHICNSPMFCVYPDTLNIKSPRYIDIVYVGPTSTQALFEFINIPNWDSSLGNNLKLNRIEKLNTTQVPYFLQPGFVIKYNNSAFSCYYLNPNPHSIYNGSTVNAHNTKTIKVWKGFNSLLIKPTVTHNELYQFNLVGGYYTSYFSMITTSSLISNVRTPLVSPRYELTSAPTNYYANVQTTILAVENVLVYDGSDDYYHYFHLEAYQNVNDYDNNIIILGISTNAANNDTISLSIGEKKRNNNIGLLCLTFKERAPPC